MSDFELLSLGFRFEGSSYNALIRVKNNNDHKEYHITIMDGSLEQLLYGDHIIYEQNGALNSDTTGSDERKAALKHEIGKVLSNYLQYHQLTS
jgi:hypothetical protein